MVALCRYGIGLIIAVVQLLVLVLAHVRMLLERVSLPLKNAGAIREFFGL